MPSSVNLAIPAKKQSRRARKLEPRIKEKKESHTMVAVPMKKENPKKEHKKVTKTVKKSVSNMKLIPEKPEKVETAKRLSARTKPSTSPNSSHEGSKTARKDSSSTKNSSSTDEKTVDTKKMEVKKEKAPRSAKADKKFDMNLARVFFSKMIETQKGMKRFEDTTLETMPESSQFSSRSVKKTGKKHKHKPLDRNIFKENGEPVWVVPDRRPGEFAVNEQGEQVRFPELMAALDEDGLDMEDGKGWLKTMADWCMDMDTRGCPEKPPIAEREPFAPMEVLEEHNRKYFSKESVFNNTAESIFILCDKALDRFVNGGESEHVNASIAEKLMQEKKGKEREESTCIVTSIKFNMDNTFCIRYDRRRPIASIRKLREKFEKWKILAEQDTQPD